MSRWRPQQFLRAGRDAGIDPTVLARAAQSGRQIIDIDPDLTPVFTLKHLAHLTSVDYGFLRAVVSRTLPEPYRVFAIRKSRSEPKAAAFRTICVPTPALMRTQRWIAKFILAHGRTHSASYAYAPGSSIVEAATLHCGCTWLIKLDARRFFESISEVAVYRAFRALGYQPLVSLELTRICTRLEKTAFRWGKRWRDDSSKAHRIPAYQNFLMGHLPQGAPTSPMLSNLCMVEFDAKVEAIAVKHGLTYTRYADDLCLSTSNKKFGRASARQAISQVQAAMAQHGLSPNSSKTRVCPPGSRKIVLGLLVDGERPRLAREFRANLRRHIHYLTREDVGPRSTPGQEDLYRFGACAITSRG